jgi:hypothetical protein
MSGVEQPRCCTSPSRRSDDRLAEETPTPAWKLSAPANVGSPWLNGKFASERGFIGEIEFRFVIDQGL